ncbi:hypothetical protein A2U01_0103462, partial [Trifolium medium]|nr:hypothetical protein [Trifolium medium]
TKVKQRWNLHLPTTTSSSSAPESWAVPPHINHPKEVSKPFCLNNSTFSITVAPPTANPATSVLPTPNTITPL